MPVAASAQTWSLASPNDKNAITISASPDGSLSYEISHDRKSIIHRSPLGLIRDDQSFARGLSLIQAGEPAPHHEEYDPLAAPNPHVDHIVNHRDLFFRNSNGAPLKIELAASDKGVAFRYCFTSNDDVSTRVLNKELTGFAIPSAARGWMQPYHAAGPYTPAYEDFYFHVSPGEPPPNSRARAVGWAFPALWHIPNSAWVLLTESGTDESFCACHLEPGSPGGVYHIAFPMADEATRGVINKNGPEPRSTLPWTMPWRIFVLGETAGDIALSSLVTDLAPPSRISDTSWIHPGRASWAWWSYPQGPVTPQLFNQFSDFAARMGWEYTLFDAGWWNVGLPEIAAHARSENLSPLAWCFASDFYDPLQREKKLAEVQSAGVQGVKVDFWCSDRQEAIAGMHGLFHDAAARAACWSIFTAAPSRAAGNAPGPITLPQKPSSVTNRISTNRVTRKKPLS